ncbi:MAG: DNA polymerase III subunit delta' [Limibacillus sp.]|jgi:DNA polymerase-3 subunit delta'
MTAELTDNKNLPAPSANPDLFDQGEAESVLLRAYNSGRLPHAWLLTGQQGIGKATLAHRFARFLFAQGEGGAGEAGLFGEALAPSSLAMEPEHPVFKRALSGGLSDLVILKKGLNDKGRPEASIPVERVRKAAEFLNKTAADGGWRVIIVDGAEDLNKNSANAILKELEEPNEKSLLLLVSHAPGRLLPTIHSRCCHLALKPLPEATVTQLLVREEPDLAPEEAAALARLSEGSIGRALDLHREGGLILLQSLTALLQDLPRLEGGKLHAFADSLVGGAKDRRAFETLRELLLWWLARMIRGAAADSYPAPVLEGEAALMQRLIGHGGLEGWMQLRDKWSEQLARADTTAPNRRQMILGVFYDMARLSA